MFGEGEQGKKQHGKGVAKRLVKRGTSGGKPWKEEPRGEQGFPDEVSGGPQGRGKADWGDGPWRREEPEIETRAWRGRRRGGAGTDWGHRHMRV